MKLEDLGKPWVNMIRKFDRTNTIVVLVGLKSEKTARTVTTEEAKLFAKTQAMDAYLEASSHTDIDLQKVYREIGKLLIERQGNIIRFPLPPSNLYSARRVNFSSLGIR